MVARRLAGAFGAELHLGRWSRLVADLNRSWHHRRVVAPTLSTGRSIPANELMRDERRQRLDRYWLPWRETVETALDDLSSGRECAFHISVHSFVERLAGEERRAHFGLLYEPSHRVERALADRLHGRLAQEGYLVRRNHPYSGRDDGFCMRMRVDRPRSRYVGMEIEMNQRWVRRPQGAQRFADALVRAFAPELGLILPPGVAGPGPC